LERTRAGLAFLRDHGLLAPELHDRAVAQISVTDDLCEAVHGAKLVQESVTERYDVKQNLFRQIDRAAAPETIVASSSSGLLISVQAVMSIRRSDRSSFARRT
jgi:3-hydroxyacyl-CoA dehydrogenase